MPEEQDMIVRLEDRLIRLEQASEDQKRQPWYRRASDVFSLLAVVAAVASVGISLWSQKEQSIGDDRRRLSAIFNEIGSVNAEMAKLAALPLPDAQKEHAGYGLQNQLVALLKDAGRLAAKFPDDLSELEKAALGAGFSQVADTEQAEFYYSDLIKSEVAPYHRAVGLRSLANLVFTKGKKHFEIVNIYYNEAINVLAGLESLHAGLERTNIYLLLARFNIARHQTDQAADNLVLAMDNLRALPCIDTLGQYAGMIRQYAGLIGFQAPVFQAESCPFIDGPTAAPQLTQFTGKYELSPEAVLEITFNGGNLEASLANQRHQLTILRRGVFELKGRDGFFIVFPGPEDGLAHAAVKIYQPNGVFPARRIE